MDTMYEYQQPRNMPLFEACIHGIVDDTGDTHLLAGEDAPNKVWEATRHDSPWRLRGSKILMNRFLGFVHAIREELPHWTKRAFHYQYVCVEEDMVHGTKFEKLAMSGTKYLFEADADRPTTSARKTTEDEKVLRSSCQNAMVIAMVMFSDVTNKYIARAVQTVTDPLHDWHVETSRRLRSALESGPWLLEQLQGAFLKVLLVMMALLYDADRLFFCGMTVDPAEMARLDEEHIGHEDELARQLGNLILAGAGARLKRCFWMLRGYPTRTILMTSSQNAVADSALNLFHQDYDRCLKWERNLDGWPGVAKVVQRSCFQKMTVVQDALVLAKFAWTMCVAIKDYVSANHTRILASVVVEDGFHAQKSSKHERANRLQRIQRAYGNLVEGNVLDGVHRYQAMKPCSVGVERAGVLESTSFRTAKPAKPRIDFDDIATTIPATSWNSPGVERLATQDTDLEMMAYCERNVCEASCGNAWLGVFLQASFGLMVREVHGVERGPWKFALSHVPDSSGFVWPAEEIAARGVPQDIVWRPDAKAHPIHDYSFTIVNLDHVEAMSFDWWSPARQYQQRAKVDCPLGIVAVARGEPMALLIIAALACFWTLAKTTLERLARHLGLAVRSGDSLFAVLWALVKHILKKSDEETLAIIVFRLGKLRCHEDTVADEMLELDDADDILDRADKEELKARRGQKKDREVEREGFEKDYREKRKAVHGPARKPEAIVRPRAKAAQRAFRYPERMRAGTLTQAELRVACPPGGHIWQMRTSPGGWQCHLPPFPRIARAASLYTDNGAARLCLADLWDNYLLLHDLERKDCPIAGLWDDA